MKRGVTSLLEMTVNPIVDAAALVIGTQLIVRHIGYCLALGARPDGRVVRRSMR